MLKQMLPAVKLTIILAFLIGLVFPAIITILAQLVFSTQANGSLIKTKDGLIIGSELIGQKFTQAKYFKSRPSAAGSGYEGLFSGGTNLGPTSAKLINGAKDAQGKDSFLGINQLAKIYAEENLLTKNEKPPADAVTYSGSGLDQHISQTNALYQARRIAKVRNLPLEKVITLVHQHTEDRQFGIFGEPRINVLKLNLALEGTIP